MQAFRYRLGLPAWAFPGWKGVYFAPTRPPLSEYARVFNAVEANTTFYRVPDQGTVGRWRDAVAGTDFRFCFKLPRSVTHERRADPDDLNAFLRAIEPLAAHLGPLLIQLPARVGPSELPAVEALLRRLPADVRAVVEVRHPRFFVEPSLLEPLLERHRAGRVVLDARALHRGDPTHPEVRAARHEKPDLPVLPAVQHRLGYVRLVLHPDPDGNGSYLAEWAARIARDVGAGHEVYVMIHCPNNLHCPAFAETFHALLRAQPGMESVAPLPPWPVPQQRDLL